MCIRDRFTGCVAPFGYRKDPEDKNHLLLDEETAPIVRQILDVYKRQIHDKGDGNPHAHILLTMRAMDETGKWLPKSRKVYDLSLIHI